VKRAANEARDIDPDWWQRGVVYHAYVRSFADSTGDGVGDLPGLFSHLDHLNDGTPASLGVDAVLLSPVNPSPGYDLGYDISDYLAIEPTLGTMDDFDAVVAGAHDRGMAVIVDLVMNHTSREHPWFVASGSDPDGPFRDWYLWRDPAPGGRRRRPPNNWRSFFGGSAWAWDAGRGQYYLHTFLPEQPDLNWRNPAVPAAMLDVARFWLGRGVDGFRLDVFNVFFKHPELRSNPRRWPGGLRGWDRQHHVHDKNQPELGAWLAEFRELLDAAPGRMSVGELFTDAPAAAAAYAAPRHLIFDFLLCETPWRATALAAAIDEREAAFEPERWPTVVLSNHDQPRHASRFARRPSRDAVAKAAAVLLLTLRGTPFVYYGEEIGMGDVRVPWRAIVDPPARRYWPFWRNRDGARALLPWTADRPARSWLPVPPDIETRNVASQAGEADSVLATYRRMVWLRRKSPALQVGGFEWVVRSIGGLLVYRRRTAEESMVVAINTRPRPRSVPLPPGVSWKPLLTTSGAGSRPQEPGPLQLGPNEAVVLLEISR
jgi:alpha-glucosidase